MNNSHDIEDPEAEANRNNKKQIKAARKPRNRVREEADDNQKKNVAYIFGVAFVIVILVLAVAFPEPTRFQYTVFRIILALAASGIASVIPGLLHVQVASWVKATGAIAVFVVVYFFSPAQLAVTSVPTPTPTPTPTPIPTSTPSPTPMPATSPRPTPTLEGFTHGVAVWQDDELPAAKLSLDTHLTSNRYSDGYIVYRSKEKYRVVRVFRNADEARAFIPAAKKINETVDDEPKLLEVWCRTPIWKAEGYFECSN